MPQNPGDSFATNENFGSPGYAPDNGDEYFWQDGGRSWGFRDGSGTGQGFADHMDPEHGIWQHARSRRPV